MDDLNLVGIIMGALVTGAIGYIGWSLKNIITKVDDHEKRIVVVETVLNILGDIREDINTIKIDVEVMKSKLK